jgi:hypothetical protein
MYKGLIERMKVLEEVVIIQQRNIDYLTKVVGCLSGKDSITVVEKYDKRKNVDVDDEKNDF